MVLIVGPTQWKIKKLVRLCGLKILVKFTFKQDTVQWLVCIRDKGFQHHVYSLFQLIKSESVYALPLVNKIT